MLPAMLRMLARELAHTLPGCPNVPLTLPRALGLGIGIDDRNLRLIGVHQLLQQAQQGEQAQQGGRGKVWEVDSNCLSGCLGKASRQRARVHARKRAPDR